MWIWAQVVQTHLDKYVYKINLHKVWKQKNTHLPSGGSHNDFNDFPEEYGMWDHLIPVDEGSIDRLIEEHQPPLMFQFTSDEGEALAQELYTHLHEPQLSVLNAWKIFGDMLVLL